MVRSPSCAPPAVSMTLSNLSTWSTAPARALSLSPILGRLCSTPFAWLCIASPTSASGSASNLTACPRTFRGSVPRRNMRSSTRRRVWHETKSSLQHLIKTTQGEIAAAFQANPLRTNNMADNIQSVTDGNFEAEVLSASNAQPVMVDFWADWCRPCHMLAPTVAEIAHDYVGKLKVMKLNVDEAINSAGRYNVRGIPTLLVFKNGQVVEQIVGAVPKDQITKALAKHLA